MGLPAWRHCGACAPLQVCPSTPDCQGPGPCRRLFLAFVVLPFNCRKEQIISNLVDIDPAGARQFTFHIEAPGIDFSCGTAAALAARARALGMLAGIALKPETPVDSILPLLGAGAVDTVLLLAVRAGFGGQKFNPAVLPKVAAVRAAFGGNIIVDGGITLGEAALPTLARAGWRAGVAWDVDHAAARVMAILLDGLPCQTQGPANHPYLHCSKRPCMLGCVHLQPRRRPGMRGQPSDLHSLGPLYADNAQSVAEAGANALVAGTTVGRYYLALFLIGQLGSLPQPCTHSAPFCIAHHARRRAAAPMFARPSARPPTAPHAMPL